MIRWFVIVALAVLLASTGCKDQRTKAVTPSTKVAAPTPAKAARRASYGDFYRQLFAPLETLVGPIDRQSLGAIVGFDAGGPLTFSVIKERHGEPFVTYVSSELAVRPEQQPNESGRYEFLVSCDDEQWVRSVITALGRMSLDEPFGHHHTVDVGSWVGADAPIQGIVFEQIYEVPIGGKHFNILRCTGITRAEMEYAQQHGSAALIEKLKQAGVYPHTATRRKSVL